MTENRTVEEYDREPTLWQTNNNGRPWRVTGLGVYELPFGPGRKFLDEGGVLSHIARGWSVSGTYEYQPGALLNWGRIFFNGNLDDIKKDKPEIALQPDGTFDPTKTWFNIDAGFVRATADQPAASRSGCSRSGSTACAARAVLVKHERRAHVQSGQPPDVPVPRGHPEPAQPAALREPEPGPDQHELRAGPGGQQHVMRFITFNSTLRF